MGECCIATGLTLSVIFLTDLLTTHRCSLLGLAHEEFDVDEAQEDQIDQ